MCTFLILKSIFNLKLKAGYKLELPKAEDQLINEQYAFTPASSFSSTKKTSKTPKQQALRKKKKTQNAAKRIVSIEKFYVEFDGSSNDTVILTVEKNEESQIKIG